MQDTFDRIRHLIAQELKTDLHKIELTTRFKEDLEADSLDVIELTIRIEREFGVKLEGEDVQSIRTIQDVYQLLLLKLSNYEELNNG